ncbi:hypothetical protein EDB89DRAFT_2203149 [Lactarius sanguifluus]|nr:hypothetical protein EDB89DRAFT_2203149 [Lactarius sanguifluus]
MHPGGALYFYHAEQRIFTDVYMYDTDLSAEIHAFATLLDNDRTQPLPTDDYDLVLDIIKVADNEPVWAYYYIDHVMNGYFDLHTVKHSPSLSPAWLLSFYGMSHSLRIPSPEQFIYSLKADRPKRTILVRILSPILFFFPKVYLLELEKVWRGKTEKVIVEALWKAFMQKLVSQWTVFVLYSTVMLAANVAFLAIPGVIVIPSDTRIRPSPAQIASSISLVFSIGSIITGLLLIQHNNLLTTKNPKNAWRYLHWMKWPVVGLEPLAIVFSLTYALLMWSVWGFFVALLLFTFQDTSGKILILVGIAAGIITTLIVWCIKHTWDPEGREEEPIEWPYEPGPQVRTSLRQGSAELSGGVV